MGIAERNSNYWWVNQRKTWHQAQAGGYMWSPKLKKNLTRNPNYDFMTEATLGDLVFSFAQRKIVAVGVATSAVYSSPKTKGFGSAVGARSDEGWRVDAGFQRLDAPFGARKPHGSDSATTAPKVPAAKDQGHH